MGLEPGEHENLRSVRFDSKDAGGRALFTGVGDSYEPPDHPDLTLETDRISIDDAADAVVNLLTDRGVVI